MSHLNFKFPKNFFWGTATSSHQIEGDKVNDWTEWERSQKRFNELKTKGLIEQYGLDNFISGKACDHYRLFHEDFKLAKDLGHNALRFSIAWSRIEPEEGVFDQKEINHYKEKVKKLKELGIEPFVTLWHWPIPVWLRDKGGWQSSKTGDYFCRYAEKVVSALKDEIKFWITLNEAELYALHSYLYGIWPPQKKNLFTYLMVINNLIKAHRQAFEIIKMIRPTFQIGVATNNVYFEAYQNNIVNILIKKLADWWINYYFLDQISDCQDFIGLNYYIHDRINYGFHKNENKIVSDMGWELYPEGIYFVLKDLQKYHKPIYITENGLADAKDEKRAWYIFETLKYVHQAISEGVDVRGYLHWSLMDNFEWDKGFWPRFGLVEIDYKTCKRKIRPSAYFYKDICLANGLTAEIVNKHKNIIYSG